MSRRSAPRRAVVSVEHRTGYGKTWWLHSLECGHVERRKRKAPAAMIGCLTCERESGARQALDGVLQGPMVEYDVEGQLASMRAAIARSIGVEPDAVALQVRPPSRIEGALVTLDALTVLRLSGLT